MTDIDWLGVDMVVREGKSLKLATKDARAAMRFFDERLIDCNTQSFYVPHGKLTAAQVAERLQTTARSVMRWRRELPPATKALCAVCGEPMWVREDGSIEEHPDRLFHTCDGIPRAESA